MMMKKIQQLLLYPYLFRRQYVLDLLEEFKNAGFDAVMLEYCNAFPYRQKARRAVSRPAYSRADVAAFCRRAKELSLEIIPKGISFSHAAEMLSLPEYRLLDDGGSCNLALAESATLMAGSLLELAAAHPDSQMIHVGGDEMFHFGHAPEAAAAIRQKGVSRYYVDFVNMVVTLVRRERPGLKIAVWSDMLIKYPQAIDHLDSAVVIFYWDYWSFGDGDCPIVSIGGGCPDMFVLDRARLPRDLARLLQNKSVRDADALPSEHLQYFASYYQMSPDRRQCRSFPYLQWFRDHRLEVVTCPLSYPEKSTFLGNFAEKIAHLKSFAARSHQTGAAAMMSCLWQPWWPLPAAMMPALAGAAVWMEHPEFTVAQFYESLAKQLGEVWTPRSLQSFFEYANDFEFNDLLTTDWQVETWEQKFAADPEELAKRGESARLLPVTQGIPGFRPGGFLAFIVEDVRLRSQMELALIEQKQIPPELRQTFERHRQMFGHFCRRYYRPTSVEAVVTARYGTALPD